MSWFTQIRNTVESAAVVAGNYYVPGSSILTAKLAATGSQKQLNSNVGKVAQVASAGVGLGIGSSVTGVAPSYVGGAISNGASAVWGKVSGLVSGAASGLLAGAAAAPAPGPQYSGQMSAPSANADYSAAISPPGIATNYSTPAAAQAKPLSAAHVAIGVAVLGVGLELVKMISKK